MDNLRLSDLTFGTICRIGITLSTCFWMPASLLLGIASAMGTMPVQGLQRDPRGVVGFIGGALQGIGCSIAMDVALVLGTLGIFAAQRIWGGSDFVLGRRKTEHR